MKATTSAKSTSRCAIWSHEQSRTGPSWQRCVLSLQARHSDRDKRRPSPKNERGFNMRVVQ